MSEKFSQRKRQQEVWRRDEQVHDLLRTELSLQFMHYTQKTLRNTHVKNTLDLHQHLTRLVQEAQQHGEMLKESRAAQSAAGPEIDRLRQQRSRTFTKGTTSQ